MRYDVSGIVSRLRGTVHHAPDRFEAMLTGEIRCDDARLISGRLEALSRPIAIGAVAYALIADMGLHPVVLAHAASLIGYADVRGEDGSTVIGMTRRGGCEVALGRRPAVTWGAGADDPAGLHRHPDLVPDAETLMIDRLPDAVTSLLPGRASSDVMRHPVLDALRLRIERVASREDLTLIQTGAPPPLGTDALVARLVDASRAKAELACARTPS